MPFFVILGSKIPIPVQDSAAGATVPPRHETEAAGLSPEAHVHPRISLHSAGMYIYLSFYYYLKLNDPTGDDSAEGAHGRPTDLVLLL